MGTKVCATVCAYDFKSSELNRMNRTLVSHIHAQFATHTVYELVLLCPVP